MIKIHNKLWYVCTKRDRDDESLAYMTHYAEDEAFNKRVSTGASWAGVDYKERNEDCGVVIENTPTKGFYIGDSVSRWSTSNKLFRVTDPRGFMVEVPTGNISTLLHHTTVVNGVVDSECVWGREGNNHILLPINSEPYLITLDQMDTLANKLISIKDIKAGDWVKFFEDKHGYYYLGKVKATWNVRGYNYSYGGWSSRGREQVYGEWVEVVDDKWVDLFLRPWYSNGELRYSVETPSKPKIVEIVKHEPISPEIEQISWYAPDRITNKAKIYERHQAAERKLISFQTK